LANQRPYLIIVATANKKMLQDILLFLTGLVVGAMNAIAGGGTLIGFPVLMATGLPALTANATSHLVVLPGAISSAFGYRRHLRKLRRVYLILIIPCVIGTAIGATILRHTPTERFQQLVPGLVLFAVILFAFQPLIHFHLHKHLRTKSKALKPLVLISAAMLPIAIYGGYFGAGFGFLMLAFLGFTKLHEIHKMNGLKNLGSVTVSIVSIICLFNSNLINWHAGLIMAAGCLGGGYYGAVFAQRISTHAVRVLVIVIGLSTAAYLGLRTY
jgi:uncharacterized membrane protein YfcA